MRVNGKKDRDKVMDCNYGKMGVYMKGFGTKTRHKG